jgi:hypothetical protein
MPKKRMIHVLLLTSLAAGAAAGLAGARAATLPRIVKHRTSRAHVKLTGPAAQAVVTAPGVMSPADTYAYWTPERMRSAQPPSMGIPGGAPPARQPAQGSGSSAPGSAEGAPTTEGT